MLKVIKNLIAITILINLAYLTSITYNTYIYAKQRKTPPTITIYKQCKPQEKEAKVIENIYDCPAIPLVEDE